MWHDAAKLLITQWQNTGVNGARKRETMVRKDVEQPREKKLNFKFQRIRVFEIVCCTSFVR